MVTRAILEEKIDNYKFRVRIPFYNKSKSAPSATPTKDLHTAVVCTLPNADLNYQVGDVVFIGFEDNDISKPVILGQLYRGTKTDSNPAIVCETLTAKVNTSLPYETHIGEILPNEIKQLQGIEKNIQFQIDILKEQAAKLDEQLHTHRYGCLIGNYPTEEDINLILKHNVGKIKLTGWQLEAADVNGDGEVNSMDVSCIQQYLEGNLTTATRIMQEFVYYDEE